jgi:hypothetical protein
MPFSSNGNEHQAHERNGPRKREKKTVAIEPGEVFTAWNAMVTGTNMPVAAKLTDTRQQEILARSADPFWLENWRAALERVRHSAFCQGSGENGWLADFDWFLQRDSVVKLIEGKFDARKKSVSSKRKPNSIPNRRPED